MSTFYVYTFPYKYHQETIRWLSQDEKEHIGWSKDWHEDKYVVVSSNYELAVAAFGKVCDGFKPEHELTRINTVTTIEINCLIITM